MEQKSHQMFLHKHWNQNKDQTHLKSVVVGPPETQRQGIGCIARSDSPSAQIPKTDPVWFSLQSMNEVMSNKVKQNTEEKKHPIQTNFILINGL